MAGGFRLGFRVQRQTELIVAHIHENPFILQPRILGVTRNVDSSLVVTDDSLELLVVSLLYLKALTLKNSVCLGDGVVL